jgi:hypothetical protein
MARQFKSHRRRARKGANALRLAALLVTCAAILAWASLGRRDEPPFLPEPMEAALPAAPPPFPAAISAPEPAPRAAPRRRVRTAGPVQIAPVDDLYVLNAAELDAISQARPQ